MEHFTNDGKVICQLCGKPYKLISPTHLKNSHGMSLDTYKEQFPDVPLSSKQFRAQQQFKSKTKVKEKPKNEKELYSDLIEEEPISPIEEIKKEEVKIEKAPVEFKTTNKVKLSFLKELYKKFPNIKENYTIEKHSLSGQIEYIYITDIADPILRIEFSFPKAAWHNNDMKQKILRQRNLEADGWRCVVIESVNPNMDELIAALTDL